MAKQRASIRGRGAEILFGEPEEVEVQPREPAEAAAEASSPQDAELPADPTEETAPAAKEESEKEPSPDKAAAEEFKSLLQGEIQVEQREQEESAVPEDGVKLSVHAAKRLRERNLSMDSEEFFKIKNGIATLKNKGGQDSLILTNKAAYIIDVNKNTIVTAMERENLGENVFTKIDSTLILD